MASVAKLSALRAALENLDQTNCPCVWIGRTGMLEFGAYPTKTTAFDFAGERLDRPASDGPEATNGLENSKEEVREVRDFISRAPRITERISLLFPDLELKCGSAKHALLEGLDEIERRVPGTLDKLSEKKARSKRPVHRELNRLYDLASQRKYAEKISSGHWVATNNKRSEALYVIRSAARLAEIELEIDAPS